MPDFSVDVTRWVEKARHRADAALRATAEDAVNRVKELTPVDTGHLRANWSAIRPDESLPIEGRATTEAITQASLGDIIVVVNPVIYARAIEYGRDIERKDGETTHVTGAGMVTQTVAELPEIARRATRRVIQGGGA